MNQPNSTQNSVPDDIALKIASSLEVTDVCSLGSCSTFWKELCGSDYVWEVLCKDRWPAIDWDQKSHEIDRKMDSNSKGWRELYVSKHNEMAGKAALVRDFVERALVNDSVEVDNYLKAIELLDSLQFGFKDIEMFLFKPKLNVLLNLVGLHYCITRLGVPVEYVVKALKRSQILTREVRVQWWKLGRLYYGFRLRDELHSRSVTLGALAAYNQEVLGVLHRGAVYEVVRVQISMAKHVRPPCSQIARA